MLQREIADIYRRRYNWESQLRWHLKSRFSDTHGRSTVERMSTCTLYTNEHDTYIDNLEAVKVRKGGWGDPNESEHRALLKHSMSTPEPPGL